MTPDELQMVQRIARKLAPKYTFSHYDIDDIVQEGVIAALQGYDKYNEEAGSLSSFMYTLINNSLKNFKRNNYIRPRPSHMSEEDWDSRQATKRNILEPMSLGTIRDEHEKNAWTKIDFINDMEVQEIFTIIDNELPTALRQDYLRMKQGVGIPKSRRLKIEETIIEILREFGYETG